MLADLPSALRLLEKNPLLAPPASVSLRLGIGIAVASGTNSNALLLATPPVSEPRQLVEVLAFSLSQRTHVFGIRMTFGARAGNVAGQMFGQAITLASFGIGVGTLLSPARSTSAALYAVSASNSITPDTVALVLVAVAAPASYMQARRAMRADPLVALRTE